VTSAADRDALYREVMRQVQARNWREADARCRELNAAHDSFAPGWLLASVIAQHLDEHERALQLAERAVAAAPDDSSALLRRAQCLDGLRRRPEALRAAAEAERASGDNPRALAAIGLFYNKTDEHFRALAVYERACRQAPDDPGRLFDRAVARRFVGQLEGAEADYDRVLELDPKHYASYTNRSKLRTQTPDRNHVGLLEQLLQRGDADANGEVRLCYALAKEYADLGRHAESWTKLERGARLRRRHLKYDITADLNTVNWLIEAFPAGPLQLIAGAPSDAPIFIVGLPRAGSTLVERILSSHSQVHAAGELRHFTLAVAAAARRTSGLDDPPLRQIIALSAQFDFAALGRDYLARCRPAAGDAPRFIDKMPVNYLYCGLIRRALPNARIIHVARTPLAACYAMYKVLFLDAYPFSYDLDELAQYYIAYRRLMDHWQRTMPGVIHELSYERLVADQAGETQRLLEFCGLEWQDACLDFHLNPAASTTESAHQVRQPIYDSAANEWRHYATQLTGLRARLEAAGIAVESPG
jgi:tetratricopeptide (TPR) repeat protein